MFDEKQLEQYRSVKASPELKSRVMSLEKSGKIYAFNRKTVSAIAACLVAVIALGSYFAVSGNMNAEIVPLPYQTASLHRATVQERVALKLDVDGNYTVSVSSGEICFNGEMSESVELEGETEIEWLAPIQGEHILTVKKGLFFKQFSLCYDSLAQNWVLE